MLTPSGCGTRTNLKRFLFVVASAFPPSPRLRRASVALARTAGGRRRPAKAGRCVHVETLRLGDIDTRPELIAVLIGQAPNGPQQLTAPVRQRQPGTMPRQKQRAAEKGRGRRRWRHSTRRRVTSRSP